MSHLVKDHLTTLAARQRLIGEFDDQFSGFREVEGVAPIGAVGTKTARQFRDDGKAAGCVQIVQPSAQSASDCRIERFTRSCIVVAQRAYVTSRKE